MLTMFAGRVLAVVQRSLAPRVRSSVRAYPRGLPLAGCLLLACAPAALFAQSGHQRNIVHKLDSPSERMEMIINTSRILTLDRDIPQAQVNNPEILELTPLSKDKIQIFARKPGVTQVNLWDDQDEIHTVDVIVFSDSQELQMLLQSRFPRAAIKVTPLSNSVILDGYVDDPDMVTRIMEMAQDYHPKVINNIRVGGVQQVLLEIKVMEVSRTKLRNAGFDWGNIGRRGDFVAQGVSGLIKGTANTSFGAATQTPGAANVLAGAGTPNMTFGVVSPGNSFFGILNLLQQQNVAKVISEPKVTTISGRPASFNSGGEFPILVPQSLGTISVQYRKYGTQVDFVPIVMGNGVIRLESRTRISEIDNSRSITINGTSVPGLTMREVDTGAELRAGQTLAIAGLVQFRHQSQRSGILWLGELPVIGAAFRNMQDTTNEIELLILITPQLVEAMDPCEVPSTGPGLATGVPSDCELVMRGHIEVPNCDPNGIMGPYPQGTPGFPGMIGAERSWRDQLPPDAIEIVPVPNSESDSERPAPQGSARRSRKPATRTTRLPETGVSSRRREAAPADRGEGPALSARSAPAPTMPTSFGPSSRKNPSSPDNRRSRADASSRKSLPGLIGPTGNDLR